MSIISALSFSSSSQACKCWFCFLVLRDPFNDSLCTSYSAESIEAISLICIKAQPLFVSSGPRRSFFDDLKSAPVTKLLLPIEEKPSVIVLDSSFTLSNLFWLSMIELKVFSFAFRSITSSSIISLEASFCFFLPLCYIFLSYFHFVFQKITNSLPNYFMYFKDFMYNL